MNHSPPPFTLAISPSLRIALARGTDIVPAMSKLLLSILWVGTLTAAFFVGRLTMESASEQSADRDAQTSTRSVLGIREKTPSTSEKDDPAAGMASAKPSIESLIAAVRVEMRGNDMEFTNPSAMMKLMAPLADLSPEEVKQALAEVERTITAPQQKSLLYSVLLGRLAETDGPGALAYAEEHLDGMGPMDGQEARMIAMTTWAQNDPDAAWDYFQKHRDDEDSSSPWGGNRMMLAPLFFAMVSHDIEDAFQRLQSLEDSERMMAIGGLVQGAAWDDDRRQVLLDEVAGMDAESKQQIHQQIISQWALMDTEGALEWAASLPEEERGNLPQAAAFALMMTDPERGANVLLEHYSAEEKPNVYASIVGHWARRDPNAAGEWLGNLPQGPELDQSRVRFAAAVASRDPQSAMAWAMIVENPDNRLQAIRNTYRQWSHTDPDAANQALDEAGLTDEQMQAITPMETPGPVDVTPQPN